MRRVFSVIAERDTKEETKIKKESKKGRKCTMLENSNEPRAESLQTHQLLLPLFFLDLSFFRYERTRVVGGFFLFFFSLGQNKSRKTFFQFSEALAMDNAWTRLVVFVFGDPHGLEGRQGGQDGTTNPNRVLALRRCNDLDAHSCWCHG
jgi:hypothetical protein